MNKLVKAELTLPSVVVLALLLTSTMGCIQSIACKPRIRRENIVVYEVSASIDQCPTVIEENSPIVLRYKTPYFRASAGIVMPPVPRNETWTVGWIQACTQMEFYNTYGDIGMWVCYCNIHLQDVYKQNKCHQQKIMQLHQTSKLSINCISWVDSQALTLQFCLNNFIRNYLVNNNQGNESRISFMSSLPFSPQLFPFFHILN